MLPPPFRLIRERPTDSAIRIVAYLIPLSALCPFVGALSDMFGRKAVGATGQVLLMIGPVVVSTSKTMTTAIGGMVLCGLGAGLNELIALAGTSELVPIKKRPAYVGAGEFSPESSA